MVFAEPYAQYGSLLKRAVEGDPETGPVPLLVTGNLEAGDPPKILVRDVLELGRAEEKLARQLAVRIGSEEATPDRLSAMRARLERSPGECAVVVHLMIPDQSETILALSSLRGVRPDADLRRDLDSLFGRAVTELRV